MKKILFFTLIFIIVGCMLISCGAPRDTDSRADNDTKTDTDLNLDNETENKDSTDTNELSSDANTESNANEQTKIEQSFDTDVNTETNSEIDTEIDTDLTTDTDAGTESNSNEETESNADTNTTTETSKGDVIDVPTDTSTETSTETEKPKPTPEVHTTTLQYTYGFDCRYSEDIPYAVLLTDDSYLSGGFGDIEVPKNITAGDTISIVHTGSIITLETYPGRSILENGEVISYSFNYAEVIHLEGENYSAEIVKSNYSHRYYRPYVILDRSGRYISLDNYTGDELYLVVDEVRGKSSDSIEKEIPEGMCPVACMLAFNPRDLEDGIPGKMYVPPLISEEAAVTLASEHFYNQFDYELPPEGYEYKAEIIEHWNTSYHHVLFSLVYIGDSTEAVLPNDAVSYTYRISKALNEISMIITNR